MKIKVGSAVIETDEVVYAKATTIKGKQRLQVGFKDKCSIFIDVTDKETQEFLQLIADADKNTKN